MLDIWIQSMTDIANDLSQMVTGLYYGGYYGGYGYGYGYGYLSYLLYMLPALLLGLWAQFKVQSTFKKYSRIDNSRNMTGAQAAKAVLNQNNLSHIRIERVSGNLTDHYDPRDEVIRLSDSVYGSTSIGAIGVAMHEAGHAVQHAEDYTPMKVRSAIVKISNLGSSVGPFMILVGAIFAGDLGRKLIVLGILLFSLVALFQLVTLPVEFNASNRALAVIRDSGMFVNEDYKGAKKVLSAAALTYVAALVTSIAQILYYVTRFLGGGRRND